MKPWAFCPLQLKLETFEVLILSIETAKEVELVKSIDPKSDNNMIMNSLLIGFINTLNASFIEKIFVIVC